MNASLSAVLFAKDARRVARFYVEVCSATIRAQDEEHVALDVQDTRLIIHRIPSHPGSSFADPPLRREAAAIRLDFVVADIVEARRRAGALGGQIDDTPPPWTDGQSGFFLGFDPEGNVFGMFHAHP